MFKHTFCFNTACVPLLCIVVAVSAAEGFLRTSKHDIIDEKGNTVILKGFGLGGWLVREGYMIQIEQGGVKWPLSHTEIENAVAELIGEADKNEFFRLWEANFITEKDIAVMASWGCNSIRLPINAKRLQPREGQPDKPPYKYTEEGFFLIDSCLAWCAKHNIRVILDLHCVPGGQTDDHIADPVVKGHAGLWEKPEVYWPLTVDLWKVIAKRYRENHTVAGYDILNEPGLEDENAADTLKPYLRSLSEQITKAIREIDTSHIIFMEGLKWSMDFSAMTPPWDKNMVYTFHKYWDNTDQSSIQKFVDLRSKYAVPVFNGETGENDNAWAQGMVDLMKKNSIGWNWWTVKKLEQTSQPYTCAIPDGYNKILKFWFGQGPKPSPEEAKKALTGLALQFNLKSGSLKLLPDVVVSLGLDTNSTPISFNNKSQKALCENRQIILRLQYHAGNTAPIKICLSVSHQSHITMGIIDIQGKTVKRLHDGDLDKGTHEVIWDGTNTVKNRVAGGVYILLLYADNTQVVKSILMK